MSLKGNLQNTLGPNTVWLSIPVLRLCNFGLEALGVGHGDKVIVPVHTFTATAEVVRYLGADPLFVDCDTETFCITYEEILKAITNNQSQVTNDSLKGIIPVHFGGHPCDMDGIMNLAHKYGLKVVEDAAHAFPTYYRNQKSEVGNQRAEVGGQRSEDGDRRSEG